MSGVTFEQRENLQPPGVIFLRKWGEAVDENARELVSPQISAYSPNSFVSE